MPSRSIRMSRSPQTTRPWGETGETTIQFNVSAASPLVGRKLAEVDFPEGAIVAAVVREGETEAIVPSGDDRLLAGDQAVVFALPEAVGPVTGLFPP